MSEKDYVERVLKYAENSFKYLTGVLSAVVTFLFFYGPTLDTTWFSMVVIFGLICAFGMILCALIIRKYLQRYRRL